MPLKDIEWTGLIPQCDFCELFDSKLVAGPIDGPTKFKKHANMCTAHYEEYGYSESTITTRKVRPNGTG